MTQPQRIGLESGESLVTRLGDLDLRGPSGAVWGMDSPQLNANLVVVRAGEAIANHRNNEVDVLMVVTAGQGQLHIDDTCVNVTTDSLVLIPRGAERSVTATTTLTYVTVHVRRTKLGVQSTPS